MCVGSVVPSKLLVYFALDSILILFVPVVKILKSLAFIPSLPLSNFTYSFAPALAIKSPSPST